MAANRIDDDLALATLLCSRLCHDLIGPVGAIGNGLELLDPPTATERDVRGLLAESARSAKAALSFLRVAFGSPGEALSTISVQELGLLAADHFQSGRRTLDWPLHGDPLPRPAAQLLFLLLLAAATATPIGGAISVASPVAAPLTLRVAATGRRVGLSPEARALLAGEAALSEAAPRDAHLPLAARAARRLGVTVRIDADAQSVSIATQPG